VLYLTGDTLAAGTGTGSASFRSYPQAEKIATPAHLLCPENLASDALGGAGLRFLTKPVATRTIVAGNPFAYLRLESDLPGGQVGVHLFDIAPDFACGAGFATGARAIATGAADLRFYNGNLIGVDFPVNRPVNIRIDITNLAEVLEPGHRLGLAVSYGDYLEHVSQPFFPRITMRFDAGAQSSQLVVPLIKGGFGGAAPTLAYPPRPFLP
jgi:predicted acyl esterase